MEWVETTAKTIDEAKDAALDRLGVAEDEAEFEVVEEPKSGLFGMTRGQARVRARVRPATVRPKQDRRRGRSGGRGRARGRGSSATNEEAGANGDSSAEAAESAEEDQQADDAQVPARTSRTEQQDQTRGGREMTDVTPQEVGDAAKAFMEGLVEAFGVEADVALTVDDIDLDVAVDGQDLGLLIGSGGRTLTAIQDVARVAAQRRLGDHETRLRVDVAGYRQRRQVALERFARSVAEQVAESGSSKAMEPMGSADRKVVHDTIASIDGVSSRSEGDDPHRRVVVSPA